MMGKINIFFFAFCAIFLGVLGQLLLKLAALRWPSNEALMQQILALFTNHYLFLGLLCYSLALLSWLFVLKYIPLSIAYPILSLSYIFVYLGSIQGYFLAEEFKYINIVGVFFIMCGITLVALPKGMQHE